jgi:hypothetical protein
MSLPFATRNPTPSETAALQLLLSTYCDGSGAERERDGTTRPNWRQIERCVADLFGVRTAEDKSIFDVIAPDDETPRPYYGLSIKSKQLPHYTFSDLDRGARVYMEVTNSPAKLWRALTDGFGISEADFRMRKFAKEIGHAVIATVLSWHVTGKREFDSANPGKVIDLKSSRYMCFSYSATKIGGSRCYQVHCFPLEYPADIIWEFTSQNCLRGYDPEHPTEPLVDWYGLSGGQLKYYPKGTKATFRTSPFLLLRPRHLSNFDRAATYFPEHFAKLDQQTLARAHLTRSAQDIRAAERRKISFSE